MNYYKRNNLEAIDVIDAWGLGFCLGNALKYIARAGRKPGATAAEDLRKAAWYLVHEAFKLEREAETQKIDYPDSPRPSR